VSIIRIEFLTFRNSTEFIIPVAITRYVGNLDNIKVLGYTDHSARVYYYTRRGIAFEIQY